MVAEIGGFMFNWQLDRPLAFFDIESTGINPRADRIIELSVVKLLPPKGQQEVRTFVVNPGIPIPPESTAIHGISDADVAGKPLFKDLAAEIYRFLENCDLAGYNIIRFDIPMLIEEFLRASINFTMEGRRLVDAHRIYHKREPRDLKAALQHYCGELYLDGHRAEADALATVRVLEGQFKRYPDLPRSLDELDKYCDLRDSSWVDRDGKLRWDKGEISINFGKKKGEKLSDLAKRDPSFLRWILKSDFASDTKAIVEKVLQGEKINPIGSSLNDQLSSLKGLDTEG
jgi:DNA polymerase-3 subunit epsilon